MSSVLDPAGQRDPFRWMLVDVNRSAGAVLLCAVTALVAAPVWAQSDDEASAPAASAPASRGSVGSATGSPPGARVPADSRGEAGGESPEALSPGRGAEPGFAGGGPYARDPYEVAPGAGGSAGESDDPYAVDPYETDPYDDGE